MSTEQFLLTLFSAVLVCGGLFAAARPDGLLEKPKRWVFLHYAGMHPRLPKWIAYPLILCATCMASLWGTLAFLLCRWLMRIHWSEELWGWWAIIILGTALINYVLWTCLTTLETIRDHYGNVSRDQVRHSGEGQGPDPQ